MAEPFQDERELLVIVIEDPALRGALVGRFSLEGETLLTLDMPQLSRGIRPISPRPAILIAEADGSGSRLGGLFAAYPWDLILVALDSGEALASDAPILIVNRGNALSLIPEALANWRRQHPPLAG